MDAVRKNEIRDIVGKVTKSSEKYQLIHATYAIRSMIKDMVVENYHQECDDLSAKIEEKIIKGIDYSEEIKRKKELERDIDQKNFRIDVEYIPSFTEKMARAIKIENAFVISLPASLANSVFDKDGNYDYVAIQKIRRLMAHELGHIMLHTKDLMNIHGTQGTLDISGDEKETEANFFADKLIELRRVRNEKVYHDGGAHKRF